MGNWVGTERNIRVFLQPMFLSIRGLCRLLVGTQGIEDSMVSHRRSLMWFVGQGVGRVSMKST